MSLYFRTADWEVVMRVLRLLVGGVCGILIVVGVAMDTVGQIEAIRNFHNGWSGRAAKI